MNFGLQLRSQTSGSVFSECLVRVANKQVLVTKFNTEEGSECVLNRNANWVTFSKYKRNLDHMRATALLIDSQAFKRSHQIVADAGTRR